MALVAWGTTGLLDSPRPCKQRAKIGEALCGAHLARSKFSLAIEIRDGGFCVWCAAPARLYMSGGQVPIALCTKHSKALARAIREGR